MNFKQLDKALWRARVKRVLVLIWALLGRLWRLIYPPTKRKLHRALHIAGMAVTAALMLAVWTSTKHHPVWKHVAETMTPLVPLLTSWRASIGWAERKIDESELPSGDAVPEEDDQLAVTGVHGKGDLP
jgi:hypothetical protein